MEQLLGGAAQPVSPPMTREENVSPEEMAAYIDGRLSGDERASVEARIARSAELRAELVEATRIAAAAEVATPRRSSIWKSAGLFVAAAAAVIAIVVVPNRDRNPGQSSPPAERRVEAEDGGRVSLGSPADNGIVPASSVSFNWSSEGDASYRITVADASGATIWTVLIPDTTVKLPPTVKLLAGHQYYWYVDALRLDGSSITSGPRSFTVASR